MKNKKEQLKKLLRLSESSNEHEANLARTKACMVMESLLEQENDDTDPIPDPIPEDDHWGFKKNEPEIITKIEKEYIYVQQHSQFSEFTTSFVNSFVSSFALCLMIVIGVFIVTIIGIL